MTRSDCGVKPPRGSLSDAGGGGRSFVSYDLGALTGGGGTPGVPGVPGARPHAARSATMPTLLSGWEQGRRKSIVGAYESFLDLSTLEADLRDYEFGERESLLPGSPPPSQPSSPSRSAIRETIELASVSHGFFLFLKSFIGGAILALPSAFSHGGLLFTCSAMTCISVWNFFCMYLLHLSGQRMEEYSIGRLSTLVSPTLGLATEASLLITQFSFCITYYLFFLDCFSVSVKWFLHCQGPDFSGPWHAALIIFSLSFVLVPLCCIRQLDKLAPAAFAADVLLLLCIAYVLGDEGVELSRSGVGANQTWVFGSAVGQSMGTAIFAFEGVGMVLPVAGCMQEPRDFSKVLLMVGAVLTALYVTFGMLGAAVFGDNTRTTILLNLSELDPSSPFPSLLQLAWCLSILATFPIQLTPAAATVERVFVCSATGSTLTRAGLVFALGALAFVVRNSFSMFLSLSGVFCCLPLAFIYPPLIHLYLAADTPFAVAMDASLLAMGIAIFVFIAYSTFSDPAPEPSQVPCQR